MDRSWSLSLNISFSGRKGKATLSIWVCKHTSARARSRASAAIEEMLSSYKNKRHGSTVEGISTATTSGELTDVAIFKSDFEI